jgi:hypothetical protein
MINPYSGRATKTKKGNKKTTQPPAVADHGDDSDSINDGNTPINSLSEYKKKHNNTKGLLAPSLLYPTTWAQQ